MPWLLIKKLTTNFDNFLGLLFSLGALIDESLGQHDKNNYLAERKCSNARSLLVMKWTIIGFLMTMSYKSVLRAILMKTEYEDTIDTIDDLLQSDKYCLMPEDSPRKDLVENDPREKFQALAKKLKYYTQGTTYGHRRNAIE